MIDREEVLKGLVHHRHLEVSRNELNHDECFDCPYRPDGEDTCASLDRMIDDALELLKEQEPVKPVVNQDEWVCGCCGTELERQKLISPNAILHDLYDYCPHCGKKVSWEAVNQE